MIPRRRIIGDWNASAQVSAPLRAKVSLCSYLTRVSITVTMISGDEPSRPLISLMKGALPRKFVRAIISARLTAADMEHMLRAAQLAGLSGLHLKPQPWQSR